MAVFYGLFIGFFIYRTLTLRDVYEMLVEAGELSAIILIVVALASVFAWATNTLGVVQPIADAIVALGLGEYGTLALLMVALIIIGMFLDGVSTFLILVPILLPVAKTYDWDLVWFGVILTMKIAIGQFTPPLAVNLMFLQDREHLDGIDHQGVLDDPRDVDRACSSCSSRHRPVAPAELDTETSRASESAVWRKSGRGSPGDGSAPTGQKSFNMGAANSVTVAYSAPLDGRPRDHRRGFDCSAHLPTANISAE